jgi:hypothetical protein
MASLQKNVSGQNFTFCLVNAASGAALVGASPSIFITKDNGAQAAGGGTVTGAGNGQYNYAPTQAETNATDVGFLFTATNAVPVNIDFHTDVVDGGGRLQVDVEAINAVTLSAQALSKSTQSICWGQASGGTSTTVVVASLNNPASLTNPGQLIGRTIIFFGATTTGGLQAQASTITGSTTGATPTLTVAAMTTAPSNGDLFAIL